MSRFDAQQILSDLDYLQIITYDEYQNAIGINVEMIFIQSRKIMLRSCFKSKSKSRERPQECLCSELL